MPTFDQFIWALLVGLAAILVGAFAWFLKSLHGSVAETRKAVDAKADRAELREIVSEIRAIEERSQAARADIFNTIRLAVENQSNTNVKVADALGQLKGALQERRSGA